MFKRIVAILSALVMVTTFVSLVRAAEPAPQAAGQQEEYLIDRDKIDNPASPMHKLGRGAMNTLTFWAEIPQAMVKVSVDKDPVTGCTLGLVQGIGTALARGATALADVLTFPIPPYDRPLMNPEYALTNADEQFRNEVW
jgi:putative exosortase-associated protein (TIGR04073 family)